VALAETRVPHGRAKSLWLVSGHRFSSAFDEAKRELPRANLIRLTRSAAAPAEQPDPHRKPALSAVFGSDTRLRNS